MLHVSFTNCMGKILMKMEKRIYKCFGFVIIYITMMNQGNMTDVYKPGEINATRNTFIKGLPAEHQDFFRNRDRFIVQNASLVTGKGNRVYDKIEFIPQEPKEIQVYSYSGRIPLNDYTRSCIHAYALAAMYDRDWQDEANPEYAVMLGSIISILASYTYYTQMKDSGLETLLARCNITVELKTWATRDEVKNSTDEVRT